MKKNNVWKQALALALSATLVLGNVSPVSAADGDEEIDMSKYEALEFTADGQMVSGDNSYVESGITFDNKGVTIVDAPIITPDEGDTTESNDGGHGKVFKFATGTQKIDNVDTQTGVNYLTSQAGSLSKYDFSNGVTLSFDIYPDAQHNVDWNYFFVIGVFEEAKRNSLTATTGLRSCFDSQKRKVEEGKSWEAYYPSLGWVNKGEYEWDYFGLEANAHKWYSMKYIYSADGLTIMINDVAVVSYPDTKGYVEDILKHLSEGQLRLGKGVLTTLEGYEGLMDNFKLQPVAPHQHKYAEGDGKRTEPTCTTAGSERKGQCTECGVVVEKILPALGHSYGALIAQTEPSCKTAGYKAHYECARCDQWAVDDEDEEDGKKEVESSDIQNGTALDHDYKEIVTKATDEKDGSIVYECKRENCDGKSLKKPGVIPKAEIAVDGTSFTYTGKAIEPKVTVTAGGKALSADNYDISYSNNVNVGTGKVKIEFKGDSYEGTVEKTFEIKAPAVQASLVLDKSSVTLYTGDASNTETVKVKTITGATKTVTWKSGDDKVAKVDANGKITAVKAGTTTVTATANGITQKVAVTVKNPTITLKSGKKKFTKKAVTVKKKKKVTYTVSVSPAKSGMKLAKLTKKQTKIAKVTLSKKGKLVIQGKKKGSFKIKITSGKATKTLTIKVK